MLPKITHQEEWKRQLLLDNLKRNRGKISNAEFEQQCNALMLQIEAREKELEDSHERLRRLRVGSHESTGQTD